MRDLRLLAGKFVLHIISNSIQCVIEHSNSQRLKLLHNCNTAYLRYSHATPYAYINYNIQISQ